MKRKPKTSKRKLREWKGWAIIVDGKLDQLWLSKCPGAIRVKISEVKSNAKK